ncbi:unnamed protein product [Cuscuta epithymum]|uniref:Uncharacterized protein n=1 Tax=Cuscuta epithymum TaxID=186058 RepID=A0AAV0G2W9_9ASTE|nr:unnamed protein product [Cuscuta epithymum]
MQVTLFGESKFRLNLSVFSRKCIVSKGEIPMCVIGKLLRQLLDIRESLGCVVLMLLAVGVHGISICVSGILQLQSFWVSSYLEFSTFWHACDFHFPVLRNRQQRSSQLK